MPISAIYRGNQAVAVIAVISATMAIVVGPSGRARAVKLSSLEMLLGTGKYAPRAFALTVIKTRRREALQKLRVAG